jgi:hypothetical protein
VRGYLSKFIELFTNQVPLPPSAFYSTSAMGSWCHTGLLFQAPRHRSFGPAPHSTGHLRRRANHKNPLLLTQPITPVKCWCRCLNHSNVLTEDALNRLQKMQNHAFVIASAAAFGNGLLLCPNNTNLIYSH